MTKAKVQIGQWVAFTYKTGKSIIHDEGTIISMDGIEATIKSRRETKTVDLNNVKAI